MSAKAVIVQELDPVTLSIEENEFLLEHLGEPPVVALRAMPDKVNPNAVRPLIERVYELSELEKHSGMIWTGTEQLKAAIRTYLEQANKWATDRRRGRVRFPSLHSFDSRNRPHRGGVGSDSGQVRTYINSKGERLPFAIPMIPDTNQAWAPDWTETTEQHFTSKLNTNTEANRIECLICGHTESFKAESRGSYNAARARMSKHLRTAKDNTDDHREAHTQEFGG